MPIGMDVSSGHCIYIQVEAKKKTSEMEAEVIFVKEDLKSGPSAKKKKLEKEIEDLEAAICGKMEVLTEDKTVEELDEEISNIQQLIEKENKKKMDVESKKNTDWEEIKTIQEGLKQKYEEDKTNIDKEIEEAEHAVQKAFREYNEAERNVQAAKNAYPLSKENVRKQTSIASKASSEWANLILSKKKSEKKKTQLEVERKEDEADVENKKKDMWTHWDTVFPAVDNELAKLQQSLDGKKQRLILFKNNNGKLDEVIEKVMEMNQLIQKKKEELGKLNENNNKNLKRNNDELDNKNEPPKQRKLNN